MRFRRHAREKPHPVITALAVMHMRATSCSVITASSARADDDDEGQIHARSSFTSMGGPPFSV
jgi:hypothetical protein